jgi:NitT/TauT family transport system substrate-binding protein
MTRAHATALIFSGAAGLTLAAPARAQAVTLRIATAPIESAAEVLYAKDMGFFAKAGIDADVQLMQGSPQITAAIASNAIDVGYGVVDTLSSAYKKGIPVAILAPAAEYVSAASRLIAGLVVPSNSPVQTAADLKGKTVAVSALHSLSETAPRVWIDRNGGDSTAVKFVEIPFPAMPAAVEAGRVDAAWITEPFLTGAKKSARVLGYGFDGISKHFIYGAWFATPQWVKDHPDVAARFASVLHQTAVWANANPDKTAEILVRYTKIDPAVVATMTRVRYGEVLAPELMQPLIDVAAKYFGFTTFPAQQLIAAP